MWSHSFPWTDLPNYPHFNYVTISFHSRSLFFCRNKTNFLLYPCILLSMMSSIRIFKVQHFLIHTYNIVGIHALKVRLWRTMQSNPLSCDWTTAILAQAIFIYKGKAGQWFHFERNILYACCRKALLCFKILFLAVSQLLRFYLARMQ